MPIPVGVGRLFISAVLIQKEPEWLVDYGDLSELFLETELSLYQFVRGHLIKHHGLPSISTVENHLKAVVPTAEDKPSYYMEQMTLRRVKNMLVKGMTEAGVFLSEDQLDPGQALGEMAKTVYEALQVINRDLVTDFREAHDLVWKHYQSKLLSDTEDGLALGWASFDKYAGGASGGDLFSLCGRPGAGKSWLLLWLALYIWNRYKVPVAFVSTEMGPRIIHDRLASIIVERPHRWLKLGGVPTALHAHYEKRLLALRQAKEPFFIIDGKFSTTVEQIAAFTARMKPAMVFVDGAYMLRHPGRLGRFERVAENCELLKQIVATDNNVPVFASWQLSREAERKIKKKKTEEIGLEDIGYSDAIGQQSSVVLGMFEAEGVETIRRRRVNVMKGREGEVGEFYIRWDFSNMNYEEVSINEVNAMLFVG